MKLKLIWKLVVFVGVLVVVLLGLIGSVSGSGIFKWSFAGFGGGGGGRFDDGVDKFAGLGGGGGSQFDDRVKQSPARRSLLTLSDEHDTLLVAALDGTINLVDPKSAKALWSFSSGPPIYSSYHASVLPAHNYFLDVGDDWKLIAHTEHGKVILDETLEQLFQITPHIREDGGVILGSKKTTVFLVDGKTGRLIHTYKSDSPTTSGPSFNKSIDEWEKSGSMNLKPDELPLYITRTDYSLTSFVANSVEVLWNLTVSDIGAAFLCQDTENSFSGPPPKLGNELPSEPGVSFNMPLSCESKAVVFRVQNPRKLEPLPMAARLRKDHHNDLTLPFPSANNNPPSPPTLKKFLDSYRNVNAEVALSLPTETKKSGNFSQQDLKKVYILTSRGTWELPVISMLLTFIISYIAHRWTGGVQKPTEQPGSSNAKTASSKKKKLRKSGKNKGSSDEERYAQIDRETKPLLNFNQMIDCDGDGRSIGKLFVSSKEIAKGSNGTIVLEGIYEGRPVAVKRLVRAHHDVAFKEIQNLIASDRHSNIVRWYGVEYDQDFVYLSLERCTCSLNDLIQMYSDSMEKLPISDHQPTKVMTEHKVRLDLLKGDMQDVGLWRANGYPSPLLLKLMRDVVSGLVHLHELGIIHRDLKPQNVLIIKERSLCAKLSDMGISKRLVGDMSSLGHHATGYGSSGWQAPEQLLHGRQTRAVDLFSLGCVLFYCITGGRHPFGEHLERDNNVAKNQVDLFLVENIPEAVDLFSHLLDPCGDHRPKALEVLHHPLFWNSEIRLSFFRDTSDRVELEDREASSSILKALESTGSVALGGKWDEKMEPSFISNIGRYRRYKYDSVRDLLRVMRNKLNHYRELPMEIQELLGAVPEGFDDYFASRFPKLLIEVYKVMYRYCKEEEWFQKYQNSDVV